LVNDDYIDWKQEVPFAVETAVGECAGVIIDLVATLLYDTEEKSGWAAASLEAGAWSDAIYHSYNVYITAAKAYLLTEDVKNNTQAAIMRDFDRLFTQEGKFQFPEESFSEHVLRINKNEPVEAFARKYYADALAFLDKIKAQRNAEHSENSLTKQPL
jgi:sulfite reductase (ferredoxin)